MSLFECLCRKAEFYHEGPNWVRSIWPTENSFSWFIKSNGKELKELLGIRKVGRDWFVDTVRFPAAAARVFRLPVEDVVGTEMV